MKNFAFVSRQSQFAFLGGSSLWVACGLDRRNVWKMCSKMIKAIEKIACVALRLEVAASEGIGDLVGSRHGAFYVVFGDLTKRTLDQRNNVIAYQGR
jgi:hypothetical protein